jgi:catechol 2,3-dioxygenase-like lactoylglutathione lyase family enzyme
MERQRLVGINHVALEVDDVEGALDFYGGLFGFAPPEREPGAAFIDMGDQFLALFQADAEESERHFGLVVPDKRQARRALEAAGAEIISGQRLDFRDPFGNRVQVVQYDQIQFTKTERVLRGMGLALGKTDEALAELRAKGLV